jgi:anti-sigma factor RsiW
MTMNRHEPFEELISGSLTGDLTDAERQRLDAHLDACAECRATLAAFADQRRIVSGLRHVAPPRDLGARVRAGVERGGFRVVPWWRRPAVMFGGVGGGLAAVAGALLALVLLNSPTEDAAVGDATATPSPTEIAVVASPTDEAQTTLPPILPTPQPNASPVQSTAPPPPTVEPSPTTTPVPASPEPDVFLALTGPFDNLNLTVQEPVPSGESPDPITEVEVVEARVS